MFGRNFYRVVFLSFGLAISWGFSINEVAAQKKAATQKNGKGGASKRKEPTPAKPDAQKQEVEWKLHSLNGFDADCLFPSTPKMERTPGGAMFYSAIKEQVVHRSNQEKPKCFFNEKTWRNV